MSPLGRTDYREYHGLIATHLGVSSPACTRGHRISCDNCSRVSKPLRIMHAQSLELYRVQNVSVTNHVAPQQNPNHYPYGILNTSSSL